MIIIIKKTKERLKSLFFILGTFLLLPFFYLQILLNKTKRRNQKQLRILIIRMGKIGDLVCATPVFREIKKKYPSSYLAALVLDYSSPIIANNPYVDEILTFKTKDGYRLATVLSLVKKIRKMNFDASVSCEHNIINSVILFWSGIPRRISSVSRFAPKSAKIQSMFNTLNVELKDTDMAYKHYLGLLKFLNIDDSNIKLEVFADPRSELKVEAFLKDIKFSEKDFSVAICPFSGVELHEWETEKWVVLAERLIEKLSAKIIFIGAANDSKKISEIRQRIKYETIDASGLFSLDELPALFKKIKLFLAIVNGPMHIADALNRPMVVITGPCSLYHQGPIGDNSVSIRQPIYCQPCLSCIETRRDCKEGHLLCMKDTKVNEVYEAVLSLVKKIYNK